MAGGRKSFIDRHFQALIYVFALLSYLTVLYYARSSGLLPMPQEGTDQRSMLLTAADLYRGILPPESYLYSFSYNLYLFALLVLAQGNLVVMRCLQAATCALIPVFIYRLSRRLRLGRGFSQAAALIYCFYGPAVLISLDFLREAPLGLCFLISIYFLCKAYTGKRTSSYVWAGIFSGLAILGRENFIPVVLLPLAMLLFKDVRRNVPLKKAAFWASGIAATLAPFIAYNLLRFGKFAIIPGHTSNVLLFIHRKEVSVSLGDPEFVKILANCPKVLWKFFSSFELQNSLCFYAHREMIDTLWIFIIPFNLILAFAILGVFFNFRKRIVLLLSTAVACYACTLLIFEMFYRYRIPIVPVLCVLAAMGVKALCAERRWARRLFMLAFVGVFFLVTYVPPNKLRPASERISVAAALIDDGRYGKAERYLIRLDKEKIANVDTLWMKLIFAVLKDGDFQKAQEIKERRPDIFTTDK